MNSFFAYAPTFAGGVFVAAGDVNGDGRAEIITGAGAGGGPHVQVFNASDGSVLQNTTQDMRVWLKDPPGVKPGSIMPNLGLNDHELDVLVAYLQSLK